MNYFRNFTISILIILSTALSGCASRYQWYQESVYGIKIKYPKDWTVHEKAEGLAVVAFKSPRKDRMDVFQENLNITVQDLGGRPMPLMQFSEMAINQLRVMYQNIEVLDSSPAVLAGKVGHKIEYVVKAEFDIKILQVWMIQGYKAYIITFTADADHYKDYAGTAWDMINSFQINQ